MTREEASFILANIDRRVCDDELNEALDIAIKALEQEPCDELDFVQPHKKVSVNLEVCKMREATQEEREGINQYIDSIAEPCEDAMSRILKRMWNCRGKHTTSIDKVKMEQILRDELPPVKPQPCEDAISREDALLALTGEWTELTDEVIHRFIKRIKALPPVNPQPCEELNFVQPHKKIEVSLSSQPKIGHWNCGDDMFEYAICSSCKHETGEAWEYAKRNFNYCPNCGAKMVKEDKQDARK